MQFKYLAATPANERKVGLIEAETQQKAIQDLHRRGLVVVSLECPTAAASIWAALNRDISLRAPISRRELLTLSQEWAGLVAAGVSVEESLGFLVSSSGPKARKILAQVKDRVKGGASLYDALSQHPACFPAEYRTLIGAGEEAGSLSDALQRLADDMVAQHGVWEDIRNALLYPAFLLVTAIAGISTLLIVVVPNLESLFGARSQTALPAMTRMVIAVSHFLREYGLAVLLLFSGLLVALVALSRTSSGRTALDRLLLRGPIFGPLVQAIETARFTRSLGTLLKGGVPVAQALPLASRTVVNRVMRRNFDEALHLVITGTSLGDAIAVRRIVPADAIGLIRMGERTGRLDTALIRAASLYEGRATRKLKALTSVLTPVLTIGFGLVAGITIYAMLSTILSINDLAGS